jgi:outer membrane protein TolC
MKHIILQFFICFGFVFFASTQQDLSLKQAIDKALENNYQIQLINTNVETAKLQNNWGSAGMIPSFTFNLGNTSNIADNSQNPATFFPGNVFINNLKASVDMNWTVFNGFGIRINKQKFEQLEQQTQGNAIVVIENTIYDVIIAYYTAVVQKQKLIVVKNLLSFSKDKLAYFKMKKDLGTSSSFDVLEFENQVLTDSSNLLLQELALKNAQRNLNLLMAESVDEVYNLDEKLTFNVPDITYDQLLSEMKASNQNLKNQFINLELQDLNTKAQKSAYYPVVSINLGASPTFNTIRLLGDNGFSTQYPTFNYYGGINAKYTIFNGWNRQRAVEIAKIQYQAAEYQVEELELKLSHQLKSLYELYYTQIKVEKMTYQMVNHAEQLWALGKERYDLGVINVFNLNDIKKAYQQSVMSYFDRIFDALKTHYDLLRITGQIAQEFK